MGIEIDKLTTSVDRLAGQAGIAAILQVLEMSCAIAVAEEAAKFILPKLVSGLWRHVDLWDLTVRRALGLVIISVCPVRHQRPSDAPQRLPQPALLQHVRLRLLNLDNMRRGDDRIWLIVVHQIGNRRVVAEFGGLFRFLRLVGFLLR